MVFNATLKNIVVMR